MRQIHGRNVRHSGVVVADWKCRCQWTPALRKGTGVVSGLQSAMLYIDGQKRLPSPSKTPAGKMVQTTA
jgi:hypothetical protein